MLLYGPITFPSAPPNALFTSRNDNNFGEVIQGVSGEANSDGDPTLHQASKAIWIYYVNFSTTIRNAQVRWAQKGIQYDSGANTNHYVNASLFQYCATGIYCNIGEAGTLYLSNVKKCTVTTPVTVFSGSVSGSMNDDCGVVSIARV